MTDNETRRRISKRLREQSFSEFMEDCRDAERYRWLRAQVNHPNVDVRMLLPALRDCTLLAGVVPEVEFDAMIDAELNREMGRKEAA